MTTRDAHVRRSEDARIHCRVERIVAIHAALAQQIGELIGARMETLRHRVSIGKVPAVLGAGRSVQRIRAVVQLDAVVLKHI